MTLLAKSERLPISRPGGVPKVEFVMSPDRSILIAYFANASLGDDLCPCAESPEDNPYQVAAQIAFLSGEERRYLAQKGELRDRVLTLGRLRLSAWLSDNAELCLEMRGSSLQAANAPCAVGLDTPGDQGNGLPRASTVSWVGESGVGLEFPSEKRRAAGAV